jgi:pimeloyl-ACP methyl ester carboxylesterase
MNRNPPALRFVQANGIELAYDSFGNAAAPPLLLIMGLGTQMIAWDEEFCERLAARGYYVIRFDNRDVGLSTLFAQAEMPDVSVLLMRSLAGLEIKKDSVPYTLSDMAADAVGLLDALGISSAHVVGASMGGAIGQELALSHPGRVRTLTSIMSTSGARGLPGPRAEALTLLMQPAPTDLAGYIARHQQAMKLLRGTATSEESEQDAQRAQRAFSRGVNPAGYKRQLAAIIASGSRKSRLAAMQTPTLVIHGDADPLVPIECGQDVAQTVPGARMLVINGMGHALPPRDWPPIIDAIAAHAV